jgi:hypothetical protein
VRIEIDQKLNFEHYLVIKVLGVVGVSTGGRRKLDGLGKNAKWIYYPPWPQQLIGVGFKT